MPEPVAQPIEAIMDAKIAPRITIREFEVTIPGRTFLRAEPSRRAARRARTCRGIGRSAPRADEVLRRYPGCPCSGTDRRGTAGIQIRTQLPRLRPAVTESRSR